MAEGTRRGKREERELTVSSGLGEVDLEDELDGLGLGVGLGGHICEEATRYV